jgi:hypothetical protein
MKVVMGGLSEEMPELHITSEMLPEVKDWKVGEKYTLVLEVEQTSVHQEREVEMGEPEGREGKKKELCAHFRILTVSPKGKYMAEKTKPQSPDKVIGAAKRTISY